MYLFPRNNDSSYPTDLVVTLESFMTVLFSSCIVKKKEQGASVFCLCGMSRVPRGQKPPVTSYLFIYFTNLKSGPRLICDLLVLAVFGGEASAATYEAVKISRKFLQILQAR